MKLKDTGLTFQDIKDKVNKYMIETYERFDFLAETADGMYIYDENGTPYLDFYAGIAVNSAGNCNPKVVAAVKDQCRRHHAYIQLSIHDSAGITCRESVRDDRHGQDLLSELRYRSKRSDDQNGT